MRSCALAALVAWGAALPCSAAASERINVPERPDDVWGVVDVAAPALELPRLSKALHRLRSFTVDLSPAALPANLGKLLEAPPLEGLDLAKPLHVVVLNRQRHPHLAIVLAAVADRAAVEASAQKGKLGVTIADGYAAIGDAAALKATAHYLHTLLAAAPEHGLHATLFVAPVWAAYGMMARLLLAQPASGSGATPTARLIEKLTLAAEQSERVDLDLDGDETALRTHLVLEVKSGSWLDGLIAAQKPSEFGLASKLQGQAASVLAAGALDFAPMSDWLLDFMFGPHPTDAVRTAWADFLRLFSKDVGFSATRSGQDQYEYEYLARVAGEADAAALFGRVTQELARATKNDSNTTARTYQMLKPFKYDGLMVSRSYATAKRTMPKGPPKKLQQYNAWATFDQLLAATMSSKPAQVIRGLIDSARHGKNALAPDSGGCAGLDEARADHDSLWVHFVPNVGMVPGTGTPSTFSEFVLRLGFRPHQVSVHLRY